MRWAERLGIEPEEWDYQHVPRADYRTAILKQQKVFHSCGITAIRNGETVRSEVGAFIGAQKEGVLQIRTQIILHIPFQYMSRKGAFDRVFNGYYQPWAYGGDRLSVGGVFLATSSDGWNIVEPEMLRQMILVGNRQDWTFIMSAGIGGEAETDSVFPILEEANRENPFEGRRFVRLHPMGVRRPDQMERMRKLGIALNPNPVLNYHTAARSLRMFDEVSKTGLLKSTAKTGFEQAATMWGITPRRWLDAGLLVSAGTNAPAVAYDPEAPFIGPYSLCTGQTLAGELIPGERISREEMLKIYTINGARTMGMERLIGSIEVGKMADLVVLDTDIIGCSDAELAKAKVLKTYFEGELVYERKA